LAAEHDLFVLEDAAQAHGASYQGRRVGSLGHAAAFSFYVTKNLAAYGEGGMVTTNDDALAARLRLLRNHGRADKADHVLVGFNSRLHELQAAILRVKLRYLEAWNQRRRDIARRYQERLQGLPLRLPGERAGCQHVYHVFATRVADRDRLCRALQQAHIGYALHYPMPANRQPAMAPWGLGDCRLPVSEQLAREILGLPIHPLLSDEQIDYVCDTVAAAWSQ
jgi:dTDP-4-amino-4,6-dideoxygalactose transaminase